MLDPFPLEMTEQAKKMWFAFGDSIERNLGPNGKLRPVMGLANKIPEHAARLAAVLTLFEDLDARELDHVALGRGIHLAQWYLGEALRLSEAGHVSDDVRAAEAALQWLHEAWPHQDGVTDGGRLVSPPDLYQLGPYSIRTKSAALQALSVLEAHGHVEKAEGKHRVRGVPRQNVYIIKGGPSDGRR